ncbi:MAG TPA: Sec-independent protein translocase protein TatB [Beijerinckiaceae bacterium]|jgi:sec-independent protein translocase protein TatB|nr:Sec-independent protein translocase protein TatB [Beijerinckiaceae bacterium]
MFDMSWGEVLVIGAVALIVIGPKDLPKALRTLGNMTSQVKKMASEFQSQFNEAMREAELDDIKKEVSGLNEQVSAFNPLGTIHDELKGAIESTPAANAAVAAPDAPAAEPAASAEAAPLPGEPAFDLALPAPPALSGPLPEPADATAAAGPVPAESPKA